MNCGTAVTSKPCSDPHIQPSWCLSGTSLEVWKWGSQWNIDHKYPLKGMDQFWGKAELIGWLWGSFECVLSAVTLQITEMNAKIHTMLAVHRHRSLLAETVLVSSTALPPAASLLQCFFRRFLCFQIPTIHFRQWKSRTLTCPHPSVYIFGEGFRLW